MTDVLTPESAQRYRRAVPNCWVVHLVVPLDEALRRAATRPRWLSDDEFAALHEADAARPPAADTRLEVAGLSLDAQVSAVASSWIGLSFD